MIQKTYNALDRIGAEILKGMAFLLMLAGLVMLVVFFPIGLGLLLAAVVCALLGR